LNFLPLFYFISMTTNSLFQFNERWFYYRSFKKRSWGRMIDVVMKALGGDLASTYAV